MKKYLFIIILYMILFPMLLYSCGDDYYDVDNVNYPAIVSDAVDLNTSVTIKGKIDQPLDTEVY